ncbi:hypothetical protein CH253_18335 [Rhodococcus sp. 06-156-3C]|nr:hypothetical protein CH248_27535 [Rhodococcus sp. 06-156-4a]OZD17894.1 hypothetical protein CH253_18335 [Rhodococcus sp. 06-156-3C]OZD20619.1 hypothetical protein CH280_03490 [Rhodococcus sp. 06-156-4C]OZD30662.1 hypothetical protein CH247_15235 [Rhodococcus sp. 06-156-3b]OZD32564.1 hypothetical protein CH284_20020 [Rhodococcus sp. 06-156-3]OZF65024.1 hypothetical protein CH290_10560 [Rhodococcus sp. 06-156-4]
MLLAYLAVLALISGALIAAFTGGDDPETAAAPVPPPTTSTAASTTAAAGPDCSMPAGDQSSGDGVIAAFEHAYYVQRSGQAAHALVSPDAPSSAPFTVVANLDAGIATVAEGTTYCLDIDPLRPGVFTLTLTESGPDGTPGVQYRQRITTTEVAGRYVIASIDQA